MKSFRLVIVLALVLAQQLAFSQGKLVNITDKYTPYVSELNQGIGILIQLDGENQLASIGNYDFNEHTVFNIGSATKKMTAILLLQEVEKQRISLSDSIGQYLKPIKNVDGALTIESLLRHRSGLGELVGRNYEADFFAQSDSIYDNNPLERIPEGNPDKVGVYEYCNTNYILLGKILEKLADKSYFDLLQERIFDPCDMAATYPYLSKRHQQIAPPVHRGEDVSAYLDYRFFANYAYAAGSVASTLNDMALFYEHLFEKKSLLNDKSLQQLVDFDDADYGLGMMKLQNGFIGHGGNNIGYAFREYYHPEERKLILVFANSQSIPFNKMLRNELFDFTNGKLSDIRFNKNITTDFKDALGVYQFDTHGMQMKMEVLEKNEHLYLAVQGEQVILISKEKDKLYNGGFGVELEFDPEKRDELIFRQNGLETTIKRIIP